MKSRRLVCQQNIFANIYKKLLTFCAKCGILNNGIKTNLYKVYACGRGKRFYQPPIMVDYRTYPTVNLFLLKGKI